MTKHRFKFTSKTILAIQPEGSATTYYYDDHTRGLGLYVTKKGVKTYFVYRRVDGKPQRIILARADEITLEQAREKTQKVHYQISEGIDPQEKKRAIRIEMTFGELWEMYLERHAKLHRSSWKYDVSIHKLNLAHWKDKKLSHITAQTIRELHAKLGKEKGVVTANHAHALIRIMFNKAIEWGWNKPNPAYAVKRFKEHSRERFLSSQEMKRFLAALDKASCENVRDYLFLSLFTGARRSNVQAMNWKDIDFDSARWTIPTTKNGKPHIVPLVEQALAILKARRLKTNGEWVFPSARSKSGHLKNPLEVWNAILKEAQITNLRLHDLRRTLGSWQAALGANSYVIGKSLGHSSQHATAIYARLDITPVRDSLDKAVNAMVGGVATT
ncbi:MAG: site-specific integrase [Alphaproteobacteria bacterium]|nr:site-specific integrase [Alphaproteobacteria bacterium]